MWRWERCEDEQMWEKMRWADVKMSRCEKMWRDVKMSRCERWVKMSRWEKMWRWADVKMRRCEDEKMWEKMWRWADVKMRRCERRCEDEQMWRWEDVREDVKMSRCEDEKMWRCEDVRWEDVKMRRCFTDPHYWKNPALRRSREKTLEFCDFESSKSHQSRRYSILFRAFAAVTCFSIRSHCVTPVYFCYLPLCREDRKILLIPIGYDKA